MKQAFLYRGNVVTRDIPVPAVQNGQVLVKTAFSCISAGTEMASVADSSKSLVKRAMEKPKNVLKVLKVGKTRGLSAMVNMVKGATGSGFGSQIGYTAAGVVAESKAIHQNFAPGQRVAVVGTNYANHAQFNAVPENLVVAVPDGVSLKDASTAALGGIAMQGVRQLAPQVNDTVVVMGLGFLGQLTVQMLRAFGCNCIGIDINQTRLSFAKEQFSIQTIAGNDPLLVEKVNMLTGGTGADGVIFTAATSSSEPMSNCFKMLRRKGCFVLVGVSGMTINREDIYKKELTFKISTSYGPGRYDASYEEGGVDYPREYVRFTEGRNIEAYFALLAQKKISLSAMPTQVCSIDEAAQAFENLKKSNPPMVSLLDYSGAGEDNAGKKVLLHPKQAPDAKKIVVGFIGAGSYVKGMHLPNMGRLHDKFYVKGIMNRSAVPAAALATQYGAAYYTTDYHDILDDADIDLVMICTRHDSHASYAIKALRAGKNVFVEKPPALNAQEMAELIAAIKETGKKFFVGYNRRFSSYAKEIKRALAAREVPVHIEYTMNAGYVPYDSWMQTAAGGGRIIGEGCHIVDLAQYLIGEKAKEVLAFPINSGCDYLCATDNVCFLITYENGSTALIRYTSNGAKAFPKETMTVCWGDKSIYLNDFTDLCANGAKISRIRTAEPDKGQLDILKAVYEALKSKDAGQLISLDELSETSEITFAVAKATQIMSCTKSSVSG